MIRKLCYLLLIILPVDNIKRFLLRIFGLCFSYQDVQFPELRSTKTKTDEDGDEVVDEEEEGERPKTLHDVHQDAFAKLKGLREKYAKEQGDDDDLDDLDDFDADDLDDLNLSNEEEDEDDE